MYWDDSMVTMSVIVSTQHISLEFVHQTTQLVSHFSETYSGKLTWIFIFHVYRHLRGYGLMHGDESVKMYEPCL